MPALKRAFLWIALVIPPLSFYTLLAKSLPTLPFADDYIGILNYLLQWKKASGLGHLNLILTYQHYDYRCMFRNAIIGTQYSIIGHTDIHSLSILGDLFVIPIFGVVYLIWRECDRPREYTLLAFVPVSWILFQLQYEGTLNFPTPEFQILPVTLFVLLTCFLASKSSTPAFWGAIVGLLFCIASNGNGLFMTIVGAIIYLQRKEFKRLAAWCGCCLVACLVYFHGYDFTVGQARTHSSNNVLSIFQHLSPAYALAFLGDIAAVSNPFPAMLFGIVLLCVFIFATRDRLFERRPALYYSALFFFITAAAVSGHRSDLGLVTALHSAYRINSTVLLILLYLYLVDRFYGARVRLVFLRVGAGLFALLLVGFNIASDRGGEKVIITKRHKVEIAMLRWQRHEPRPPISLSADDLTAENEERGSFEPIEPNLSDAIREGILILPKLPIGD
ncbi:MAG: hypothetical protein P4L87_07895 [Formivibrio sp.]|nr:hypothetical protein [Formivibrio sp.]